LSTPGASLPLIQIWANIADFDQKMYPTPYGDPMPDALMPEKQVFPGTF